MTQITSLEELIQRKQQQVCLRLHPAGLSTDEPAQIQPQVTRKPNLWLGQCRGAVGSLQHTVRTTRTAAFKDKAL